MADHLARLGLLVLLVSVAMAVLGAVGVAVWNPDTDPPPSEATECLDPPCFGGGGMPGPESFPVVLPFLGYGLAILLGLPSAVAAGWDCVHGRLSQGFRRLLVFAGPLLLVVGTEIVPHVVNPCLVADLSGGPLPRFCERTESGPDFSGRLHALNHALVGAVPMLVLYCWALRRWRPDVFGGR